MTTDGQAPSPPAMFLGRASLRADPALDRSQAGARGARKLVVSALWPEREEALRESRWRPPSRTGRAGVLAGVGFELAVFTERAHQDRHLHRIGTEIYTVLEGEMSIEVEGERFVLTAGDSLLVRPGAAHAVEPARGPFLAQVVTIDSGGAGDKLVVE